MSRHSRGCPSPSGPASRAPRRPSSWALTGSLEWLRRYASITAATVRRRWFRRGSTPLWPQAILSAVRRGPQMMYRNQAHTPMLDTHQRARQAEAARAIVGAAPATATKAAAFLENLTVPLWAMRRRRGPPSSSADRVVHWTVQRGLRAGGDDGKCDPRRGGHCHAEGVTGRGGGHAVRHVFACPAVTDSIPACVRPRSRARRSSRPRERPDG